MHPRIELYKIRSEILLRKAVRVVARYVVNVLYALDCLLNAVLGGCPKETVSSRLGRALKKNPDNAVAEAICRVLDLFERNHCEESTKPNPCTKETQ